MVNQRVRLGWAVILLTRALRRTRTLHDGGRVTQQLLLSIKESGYCSLTDATVLGNVTVEPNGGLDLNATGADSPRAKSTMTVHGNLTVAGANAYADVNPGVVVDGTSTLFNADDLQISSATVHNVLAQNSQDVYLAGSDVYGNVLVNNPQSSGDLSQNNFITGNIALNGAAAGDPTFPNSWYISGPQSIGGSVILTNNQAVTDVDTNHIAHDLICTGNNPPPTTFGNQVDGRATGQCATPTNP